MFHTIKNSFVNLYLIEEPHQLTLIDAGVAKTAVRLVLKKIDELNRKPSDLKHILITHADGDHYGGAKAIKLATGAKIYASKLEAQAMHEGRASRALPMKGIAGALFKMIERYVLPMQPVDVDEIVVPGHSLPIMGGTQIIATPGHTPDHVSYFVPTKQWLFAGDSLNATTGVLKWVSGPVQWNYQLGMASVQTQAALGATTVACGHGKVITGKITYPDFTKS
jgi:glyoxylase-like metal-dependent hydrolase (beta-lactamase superfamily II)